MIYYVEGVYQSWISGKFENSPDILKAIRKYWYGPEFSASYHTYFLMKPGKYAIPYVFILRIVLACKIAILPWVFKPPMQLCVHVIFVAIRAKISNSWNF